MLLAVPLMVFTAGIGSADPPLLYLGIYSSGSQLNTYDITADTLTLVKTNFAQYTFMDVAPDGTLWGEAFDSLYTVSSLTGEATYVSSLNVDTSGFTFKPDGSLYVHEYSNRTGSWKHWLYSGNAATGELDLIGEITGIVVGMYGIEYANGVLYGCYDNALYSINTTTGVATFIGAGTDAWDMDYGSDGVMRGADPTFDSLYTINLGTGSQTLVKTFEASCWGIASAGIGGLAPNCAVTVPWYVDNAGVGQSIPPQDGNIASLIYLHNNLSTPLDCVIEYYTEGGVNIGPASPNDMFSIPANASIAFRPVADDPDSATGGQEGVAGRAVPNRPSGTADGNDNKKNGSIVIRWSGDPNDVQGEVLTYQAKSTWGSYQSSCLLPPSITTVSPASGSCSIAVPWYVDNALPAASFPPSSGITTLIYLHNNRTESLNCTIQYYTQNGTFIGPSVPDNDFTIPASASIAFRPVADDPSSVQGGQEAPPGQAVPNRPTGTSGGNDNKKNGSIVISWTGSPTDIQGLLTTSTITSLYGQSVSQSADPLPPGILVP